MMGSREVTLPGIKLRSGGKDNMISTPFHVESRNMTYIFYEDLLDSRETMKYVKCMTVRAPRRRVTAAYWGRLNTMLRSIELWAGRC